MQSTQPKADLNEELTGAVTDLATERGNFTLTKSTVGDYLARLGLYSAEAGDAYFDPSVAATFQRIALDIRKNPIKQRMLRDLCRGGTLPPLVVLDRPGESRSLEIIDGLQRTHVIAEALRALIANKAGKQLED